MSANFADYFQVDELRNKLEQKNKLIEKKTQEALQVIFKIRIQCKGRYENKI